MELQATLQPLIDKLQGWIEGAIAMTPNFVVALLVFAGFLLLSRIAHRLTSRLGDRVAENDAIVRLFSTVVKYSVLLAGFLVALGVVGLQKAVVSILAGAGVAGLAIGFAFQDLAANFIAGVAMGVRKPFRIGDLIQTADFLGHVETINLRNTIVRLLDGRRVIVPNRMVFENPLVNFHTHGQRRVELGVGVAYDTDLEGATRIAREAVEALDFRSEGTEVDVVAKEFGASSIDFLVRFWIDFPGEDFFEARHRGVLAIKRAFDEAGISIPFPIRTLDFSGFEADVRPLMIEREGLDASAA